MKILVAEVISFRELQFFIAPQAYCEIFFIDKDNELIHRRGNDEGVNKAESYKSYIRVCNSINCDYKMVSFKLLDIKCCQKHFFVRSIKAFIHCKQH